MSDQGSSPLRRYRRRILGWGVLGVLVLCGIAAPLFLRSVERDLEHRVPTELAERGFDGVSAAFSGQDGVLRCVAPLAEPEDAIDAAIDVWGVRAIELDRSCRVGGSEGTDAGSTTSPDSTVTGSSLAPTSTTAADVAPEALAVLDQLAGIAKQIDGVTITVEGHTDSDGVPAENQTLSEERVAVVLAGLVDRGVPAADLESNGLGSTRPIEVGGVEDKAASRRIEFRVTIAAGA